MTHWTKWHWTLLIIWLVLLLNLNAQMTQLLTNLWYDMTTEWFWKESLWSLSGGIMNGAMRGSYLYEMLVGPAPGPALLSIHQRHSQPIKMCPGVQTIWDGQTLANTMGRENVPKSSTKNTIFFYSCKPCTQSPGSLKEAELMCSGGPQIWMIWHDIKLVLFWFTLLGTPCVRSSS